MRHPASPKQPNEATRGSYDAYIAGFGQSLFLTLAAYYLATHHLLVGRALIIAIVCLGVLQLLVQLIFFLHLGAEGKPRWNLLAFQFMLMVVLILVGGSLWIMHNLDYQMMSPHNLDTQIKQDEGIPR